MSYNYGHFRAQHYKIEDFEGPRPGRLAPALTVKTLDGRGVSLHDFRGSPVVLETGSVTSPIYAGKIEAMNELAARFPDVRFLLLYVRETHPGSRISAHRCDEDKARCARRAQRELGEWRPILLDDLHGTMHRRFGELPNMVYVLDACSRVVHRAKWNDVREVDSALRALEGECSPPGTESTRFVTPASLSVADFALGGWDALLDFMVAMPQLLLDNVVRHRLRPDPTSELAW